MQRFRTLVFVNPGVGSREGFGTLHALKKGKKGSLKVVYMSMNFRAPDGFVDYQQIEAKAEAVIARFEANRDLMWKQDGSALAELLQAQIFARAVLERIRNQTDS